MRLSYLILGALSLTAAELVITKSSTALAQQSCAVSADKPLVNQNDRVISGAGSHGPKCSSAPLLRVRLKQDRTFWFDRILDKEQKTGSDVSVSVRYDCKGTGSMRVYVESLSNNRKVQSPRVSSHLCS